jgi:flagellar biosynthesis protein FlhG
MKILFNHHGIKHFKVLMNMVTDEGEARSVYANLSNVLTRFMHGISIDYAGHILRDDCLVKSVTKRKPVICSFPESSSSKGFEALAQYVVQQTGTAGMDGNIKFFWKRLMNGAQGI